MDARGVCCAADTYFGAPWPDNDKAIWWCKTKGRCVGNSGLSLWNATLTGEVLGPRDADSFGPIDSHVHQRLATQQRPVPPSEVAEKFAMEYTARRTYFTPFGCHKVLCCAAFGRSASAELVHGARAADADRPGADADARRRRA